ncbi:hypothetical protein EYF80_009517 [Liparis tanakae]|uniref:Uncharacterized protein n=1 Tax=Liparis tanakae TaxID=230148 RepID=A0A4Z2ISD3_9TELE|nr:hypothetical protein EYF80_009517 [Liparis tanakae]
MNCEYGCGTLLGPTLPKQPGGGDKLWHVPEAWVASCRAVLDADWNYSHWFGAVMGSGRSKPTCRYKHTETSPGVPHKGSLRPMPLSVQGF